MIRRMAEPHAILFTAFEPSGDALAAEVIEVLRQRRGDLPIYGFGGRHMAQAGARLLEETTQHAVMFAGAAAQAWTHHRRLRRLKQWLHDHPLAVLVPVDSPAANWSVCKLIRRTQPEATIVHLVAPQLWAWASWRIHRLRRLTDHVLCLLPFESEWFESRGVKTTFIGHPLFEPAAEAARQDAHHQVPSSDLPSTGSPRIALLPGSRAGEIRSNWPTMIRALKLLLPHRPDMTIAAGMVDLRGRQWVDRATVEAGEREFVQEQVTLVEGATDTVIAWADVVLAASGTVILQVAAHRKPVVAMYHVNPLSWYFVGRWIVHTRTFTLANLIAESMGLDKPVPELIPHFKNAQRVADTLKRLIEDDVARRKQIETFEKIAQAFGGVSFAAAAAGELIARVGDVESDVGGHENFHQTEA